MAISTTATNWTTRSVGNVVAATGNYQGSASTTLLVPVLLRITKGNELIYVNDVNTDATFSAANKADTGCLHLSG